LDKKQSVINRLLTVAILIIGTSIYVLSATQAGLFTDVKPGPPLEVTILTWLKYGVMCLGAVLMVYGLVWSYRRYTYVMSGVALLLFSFLIPYLNYRPPCVVGCW
jgi:hypothetical protein